MEIVNEKKLSLIRRYPTEIIIVGLAAWCSIQQVQIQKQERNIERYLIEDKRALLEIIADNKSVIKDNTIVIDRNNLILSKIFKIDVQQNYIPQEFRDHPGTGKPKNRRATN